MHALKTEIPPEGKAVIVSYKLDDGSYKHDVAYYCGGSFYNLAYDEHLGVLRKQFVSEPVESWTLAVKE
jgi:hypothetical protein